MRTTTSLVAIAMLASASAAAGSDSLALSRTNTAVVVVEFPKQWTEPGLYNWLIREEYESRDVLENTQRFLSRVRKLG